jgi:phage portal protein BeeE
MRPFIDRFEKAINRVLPERQYMKLNVDATLRTDIATRIKVQGWQVADGRLSVNEARRQEDNPPVKGGDRHNFLLPASVSDKPTTEPTRSAPSTEGETQ